jgi:multicomponent Na+:H+ antiporter subunit D
MDWGFWLPQIMLFSSLIPGLVIFLLRDDQFWLRTTLNMTASAVKLFLVGVLAWGVLEQGLTYESRLPFLYDQELILRVEPLSLMLVGLSSVLWFITTIYAIGYLEDSPNRTRFFGFFSLCVTSTIGIALAGNLITFLIFYEMLSVVTYPLVVHRGTPAAMAAGRTYLLYTLGGGVLLLLAIVWLQSMAGPIEFTPGGTIEHLVDEHRTSLIIIFVLMIAGLGVKAAIVPLHRWLPEAMIAPAPVSALLHAVAVVKAGAYGIVRVVYDVYGLELSTELGVLMPLAIVASFTIIYGSIRALSEFELKRRLAYSTVSQVSYIALGTALIGPAATVGALVHLIHQGIMKITLFFCAGVFAETRHIHDIREMSGIGRTMPLTMSAFTLGAFGMIGVPPMAGFVSKWFLGIGSLQSDQPWVIVILVASSVLNAAYFLPIVYTGWFGKPESEYDGPEIEPEQFTRAEAPWALLGPSLTTAGFSILAGLLAAWAYSPLSLAEIVSNQRVFLP